MLWGWEAAAGLGQQTWGSRREESQHQDVLLTCCKVGLCGHALRNGGSAGLLGQRQRRAWQEELWGWGDVGLESCEGGAMWGWGAVRVGRCGAGEMWGFNSLAVS